MVLSSDLTYVSVKTVSCLFFKITVYRSIPYPLSLVIEVMHKAWHYASAVRVGHLSGNNVHRQPSILRNIEE